MSIVQIGLTEMSPTQVWLNIRVFISPPIPFRDPSPKSLHLLSVGHSLSFSVTILFHFDTTPAKISKTGATIGGRSGRRPFCSCRLGSQISAFFRAGVL